MKENPYLSELVRLSQTQSDINQHLLVLFYYASLCRSVVEFGVRGGVSTVAFFAGLYQRLMITPGTARYIGFDISPACRSVIDRLRLSDTTEAMQANFFVADTKEESTSDLYLLPFQSVDLLFIDTLHDADQCYHELIHNSDNVDKYIILHDTEIYAKRGETPGKPGLNAAIKQWQMERHDWQCSRVFTNNNGLTVFERINPEKLK